MTTITTTHENFAALGLSAPLLKAVIELGFKHPTPIQVAVIPPALEGRDIIGLAQTGSGKTAAFALPLAERLPEGSDLCGLILCPTREIALQTKKFLDVLGKNHHLKTVCVIGGVGMGGQIQDLKKKPNVLVATPGRLYDLMERGLVKLDKIQELVLDEADHMLDMGFLPQIRQILKSVPQNRHTMLFSATMPREIVQLTKNFTRDAVKIDILPENKAAEGITHQLYLVKAEDKEACLLSLAKNFEGATLVFVRMKMDADWLAKILERDGQQVETIHSDRSQSERERALGSFRSGKHRILVATDIASRGIDVPGIAHVINYDMPENLEDYIHRAGRTARANTVGIVSTVATWQDKPMVKKIEEVLGKPLPRCTAPGVAPDVEFVVKPGHRMGARGRRR